VVDSVVEVMMASGIDSSAWYKTDPSESVDHRRRFCGHIE